MKRSSLALLGGAALGAWVLTRAIRGGYSFAGKVVLISGGSRGLGLVIARQLAKEGARFALLARDKEELARAKADLTSRGAEAFIVTCDLASREQIVAAVNQVVAHFGNVDVLINNAGVIEMGPVDHMNREDFERSL